MTATRTPPEHRAITQARADRSADSLRVTLRCGNDDAVIKFALAGDDLRGARDVTLAGVPLRNPAAMWRPVIATPEGVQYTRFVLRGTRPLEHGGIALTLDAVGSPVGIHEEQDEYLCDVIDLKLSDEPVFDRLEWEFRPSERSFGEGDTAAAFRGFSYRYRLVSSSPTRTIYRLFDRATWEIGGAVTGNTLILQGQCNGPVTELTRDTYFTTACNYYGAEMRGAMDPNARVSFQRLPRIGTIQAFDMLAHERGALIGLFEPLEEILTVVQKNVGEDCLHVIDEHRRPRAATFETNAKHILFTDAPRGRGQGVEGPRGQGKDFASAISTSSPSSPRPLDPSTPASQSWSLEAKKNLWWSIYESTHEAARTRAGINRSPVLPRVWIPQVGTDTAEIQGRKLPREKFLYDLADNAVPMWADMGVKEICTHSMWVSDYTLDRFKTKQDSHLHGGLTVGSICNMRDLTIDPLWGGVDGLAYFTKAAHKHGMSVQIWWATHMSRRADIYKEHPDWMAIARDGHANGGGFGRSSIITMNLNAPGCIDWVVSKFKAIHDATGVDGVFHDSYGNMTFLPMNFADAQRRGQQHAYEQLVARLQAIGIKTFTIEGIGPYGVGHFGMSLLPSDFKMYGKGYQYALDWWLGHEDMVYGLNMGIGQRPWNEDQRARVFAFHCLASGGRFGFTTHEGGVEKWTGWWRDMNRMHARLGVIEGRRELLEQSRGVVWHADGKRLLFAYAAMDFTAGAGARVVRVDANGEHAVTLNAGTFHTEPLCVYRLG